MSSRPNQHFIEKADLSITNLTNDGGLLVPEQAKQFIELVIDESVLLGMVTTLPMAGPTFELSKVGFTSRVLRPAVENQALGVGDRVKPELGKVSLATKEVIGEVRIPYGVVEDNIAQGSFTDYVMQLLGKAISRDIEELVINGDTNSADTYLKLFNGILAQASSLTVNAGGVRLSKSTLKTMVQTMPSKYLRKAKNLAFLTSKNAVIDYVDSLSNRQTPLGDSKLLGEASGEYLGYPITTIPLFPETLGAGNKTNVLFCEPKNIHVGIQRDIRIETGKDISAREYIVVATMRLACKFQHEPAVVKATEVLAAAG